MHNKTVKKCTIHIEKNIKVCYPIKEGEINEINKKRLYA